MLLKRQGFPEEGEFVLATVTAVQHNSVFTTLDEYGKTGLIHISEISPGRIRNIRDFVVEGKKIVCLVLRVDQEKGHIDLSLRRVNENQKRNKINAIKQEQKAEKIVEYVSKKLNIGFTLFYKEVFGAVKDKYSGLYGYLEDVAFGKAKIKGLDKEKGEALLKAAQDRIKPTEIEVSSEFKISVFDPDGVSILKEAILKSVPNPEMKIRYTGGGKYKLHFKAPSYKEADQAVEVFKESLISAIDQSKGEVTFLKK